MGDAIVRAIVFRVRPKEDFYYTSSAWRLSFRKAVDQERARIVEQAFAFEDRQEAMGWPQLAGHGAQTQRAPTATNGGAYSDFREAMSMEKRYHIGLEEPLVGFVHLLDRYHFYVSGDVMGTAEVEHFLRSGNAADARAGQAAAAEDEGEGRDHQGLRRGTNERHVPIEAEQVEVPIPTCSPGSPRKCGPKCAPDWAALAES